jgi:hypothetical protein
MRFNTEVIELRSLRLNLKFKGTELLINSPAQKHKFSVCWFITQFTVNLPEITAAFCMAVET